MGNIQNIRIRMTAAHTATPYHTSAPTLYRLAALTASSNCRPIRTKTRPLSSRILTCQTLTAMRRAGALNSCGLFHDTYSPAVTVARTPETCAISAGRYAIYGARSERQVVTIG